ncbi:hypothetical protein DERP_006688, partial [Dermatophagoides pteronyssinus]
MVAKQIGGPQKLRKLWQTCQLNSKNEPKEKRNHLIRLLDCCLVYFQEEELSFDNNHNRPTTSTNQLQRTTHYCLGNWLIHQFIIDLSNHSHSTFSNLNPSDDQPNRLFDGYFLHDHVGFKFLKCFEHFLAHEGGSCIYNIELAKIFILVLGHFLNINHDDNDEHSIATDCSTKIENQTNFKEDLYLKTLNRNEPMDILSPIKVKSWFKSKDNATAVSLFGGRLTATKKSKHRYNNDDDDGSSSSDDERDDHRQRLKVIDMVPCLVNATDDDNDNDDTNIEMPVVTMADVNPTKKQLIMILEHLLFKLVSFEKNGFRSIQQDEDRGNGGFSVQVSMLIIRELSYLMHKSFANKINIEIIQLNRLLLTSCTVVCRNRPLVGIELIDKVGLIESWMKLVNHHHTDNWNEFIETGNGLLTLMIAISQSLTHLHYTVDWNNITMATNLFHSFIAFMFAASDSEDLDNDNGVDDNDDEKHSNLATFLLKIVKRIGFNGQPHVNDGRLYRMIELLKQLHIAIQYNHSLSCHRQICRRRKRRHIRCNLSPFLVHHHFHININSSSSGMDKFPCAILYSLLIKVILLLAKNHESSSPSSSSVVVGRLLNHSSQQLSQLIICCCVLRRYCKYLLIIATTVTAGSLASSIRMAIFNLIELNVRIQRHQPTNGKRSSSTSSSSSATQYLNECSFCRLSNGSVDDGGEPLQQHYEQESLSSPQYSEGYATDNGNGCWLSSYNNKQKQMEWDNCLMILLANHYRTLLKSDSIQTRQSVYRHLYNLFCLVDNHCQQSILSHVIIPIISHPNHNQSSYPSDVCLFGLRLLTAAAAAATPEPAINKRNDQNGAKDGQSLIQMISKQKAWPAIIQYISYSNHESSDNHISDELACLSIDLLRNLLMSELTDNTIDDQLQTIGIIMDLFEDHFAECIRPKTIEHFESNQPNPTMESLNEYFEYYKHRSFDIVIDNPTDQIVNQRIDRLTKIFINLNRLAWLGNSTIKLYPKLVHLLNNNEFTWKLWFYSGKLFKQTLNEFKLLVASSTPREKHWKFCEHLISLMESLLSLVQRLESSIDSNQTTIDEFIGDQFNCLIDHVNRILQLNPIASSSSMITQLVGQLLSMLIRVSFDCSIINVEHKSQTDLLVVESHQQRTSSFDSVVVMSDQCNDDHDDNLQSFDLNIDDDGYEADIECLARQSKKMVAAKHDSTECPSPSLRNPLLLCTVLKFLSEWLVAKKQQPQSQQPNIDRDSNLKNDLNMVAMCFKQILGYCQDNHDNISIMANFQQTLVKHFRWLLLSTLNNEYKPLKKLLLHLLIRLLPNRLTSQSIQMLIELCKEKDADYESLLSLMNKSLFSSEDADDQRNQSPLPQYSLRYPTTRLSLNDKQTTKITDWVDELIDSMNDDDDDDDGIDNNNDNDNIAIRSFALAIPLNGSRIKHQIPLRLTLAYWIFLEKRAPLVEKTRKNSGSQSGHHHSNELHVCSLVLDCITVEIWFDYRYNRFVYRLTRKSNGKIFCLNENFMPSIRADNLGCWNLICLDFEEQCNNHSHSIQMRQILNGGPEKLLKWSYPATLYNHHTNRRTNESTASNCAVLLGSNQSHRITDFHYKLSNVLLFREHLPPFGRILLCSLGPDFHHFHHLGDDSIQRNEYFVLPRQLAIDESLLDMLTTLMSSSTATKNCLIRNSSHWIMANLVMVYRASKPNVYYLWPAQQRTESNSMMNPLLRTFLQRTNQSISSSSSFENADDEEAQIYCIKLNGALNRIDESNVARIISDTGGISVFLFLLLYLMERTDNQQIWNESMELILRTYHSHYYHGFMFDCYHQAYSLISYSLNRAGKSPTTSMLKTFAQFCLYWPSNNNGQQYPLIIVSSNITTFIDSWRIWIRNPATNKLFFQILWSLTSPSNPFQSYNLLLLLERTDTFDHLMNMIKDGHLNLMIDHNHNGGVHLFDSYDHLIRFIQSLIENSCGKQPRLLRSVMDCLLLLQPTQWLHVNQTKASFYYIFPSTWLMVKDSCEVTNDDDLDMIELKNLNKHSQQQLFLPQSTTNVDDDSDDPDDDWEIVSEFVVDNQPNKKNDDNELPTMSTNGNRNDNQHDCQAITEELIRFLDRYVDQMLANDDCLLSSSSENIALFDFLIVLVNNPSGQVRRQALATFFKLSQLLGFQSPEQEWSKRKTLGLLMISNQLYHYLADESIMNCCIGFLFNLTNQRRLDDLCKHPESMIIDLKRWVAKVSLENFIPLLALLPKCFEPISLCYQILQILYHTLDQMTINQLNDLHKQYGLAQSLSKLLINVNTTLSIPAEDQNKYNREHLNESIYRIVAMISTGYNNDCHQDMHLYDYLLNDLINYYAMIERKVSSQTVVTTIRNVQITIFRSCFESFDRIYRTASSNKSGSGQLNAKTIIDRIKLVVRKSVDFIIGRNAKIDLGQKEKYFQRELLYHLLELIDQIENKNNPTKKTWLWKSFSSNNRDYLKSLLNQLLTFLMSHLQSLDDRIFCLHLFYEKSHQFDQLKQFVDKHDDQFRFLMDEFLRDLIDFGVKELNIFSWSAFDESFVSVNNDNDSQQQQPSAILMSHVYRKFRHQFNLDMGMDKDQYFFKSILAGWHERIKAARNDYETRLHRSSSRIFGEMSMVYDKVVNEATRVNDRIILAQNCQKKRYLRYLKRQQLANRTQQNRLIQLIGQLLHEKSCWFLPEYYPQSWELSPFECQQGRIRMKMERCFLEMDDRYVMSTDDDDHPRQLRSRQLFATFMDQQSSPVSINELSKESMVDDNDNDETLLFISSANVILYDDQIDGEILCKRNKIEFVCNANHHGDNDHFDNSFSSKRVFFQNFSIDLDEIEELRKCRYELQNRAIEILLESGLTYLISFESITDRDECYHQLIQNRDLLINLNDSISLVSLTQMWRERHLSNFDYLMQLNRLSGRTFNDLMQYPVFPFVLSDYSSQILNLLDGRCYRDLAKPIAVQKKEREKYYIDQYDYIEAENRNIRDHHAKTKKTDVVQSSITSIPYHYGAHYSNSGIVLYYLVRLPPYTQMFLHYQDRNFDLPDRSFHSIQTTWRLATEDSTNGFKEMIPEFFYLPEFLQNFERFNLGIRQNGERVDSVKLPPWSRGNARLFTLINRQALESNYVTRHLNHWFDLIFGYKQSGPAAIEAINVFHPATHFTADLSRIEDCVKRNALKTMIKTYGQMPSQLFQMPHPAIQTEVASAMECNNDDHNVIAAMNEVNGLKWGNYVGSPIYQTPVICFQKRFAFAIDRLVALPTNDLLLLPRNCSPLVAYNQARNPFINTSYIIFYALCTWSPHHTTVWFRNQQDKRLFYAENAFLDEICLCQSIPDYDWILIGYRSGRIIAYRLKFDKQYDLHNIQLKDRPSMFVGHQSPITSITINRNFHLALSTDSNGRCIVWDMNKQQYLRTLLDNNPDVSAVMSTISNTMGDMAIVTYGKQQQQQLTSQLHVFTLNGQPIADIRTNHCEPYITAICYSSCPEGISINVIATGLSDGSIRLWSSWDLTLIRIIASIASNCLSPII